MEKPWEKPEVKMVIDIFNGSLSSIEQLDRREERIKRDFVQRQCNISNNSD